MNCQGSFTKLDAVPGLEPNVQYAFHDCVVLSWIGGNAKSFYWKEQMHGRRCSEMCLEEGELDSSLYKRPKLFSSMGKDKIENTTELFCSHKRSHIEYIML